MTSYLGTITIEDVSESVIKDGELNPVLYITQDYVREEKVGKDKIIVFFTEDILNIVSLVNGLMIKVEIDDTDMKWSNVLKNNPELLEIKRYYHRKKGECIGISMIGMASSGIGELYITKNFREVRVGGIIEPLFVEMLDDKGITNKITNFLIKNDTKIHIAMASVAVIFTILTILKGILFN